MTNMYKFSGKLGSFSERAYTSTLIRLYIQMLRLRQDAPFPSQTAKAQEMIRRARSKVCLHLV